MYHPADDTSEFIELLNTSDAITLDLSGVAFTSGIEFTVPTDTFLAPGKRLVISSFTSGKLSNSGETLKIDGGDGSTIAEFTYSDSAPWPNSPDGSGPSLVYRGGDPALPQNWRASTTPGGNPGTSDSVPYTGGDLLAYALIAPPEFNFSSGTMQVTPHLGADDVELIPQWSNDLINWYESDFSFLSSDPMTWNIPNSAPTRFSRLKLRLR